MQRYSDILATAIAPAIWGSSYIIATEFLPNVHPMMVAMLRALPAGLLLLLFVRSLPAGVWWWRVAVLGALNFSIFWYLLFIAAYRLPGGVAATVGSVQPLIVIFISALILGSALRAGSVIGALVGIAGVALLVLTPRATLDFVGVAAGVGSAISMAFGTVLTRYWKPTVPPLTLAAWQLTAGGLLLLPIVFIIEPALPRFTLANIAGLAYLGLIGAALTYIIWFRGLARLDPAIASSLGLLSPVTAVLLGWVFLGQDLTPVQLVGMVLVIGSVMLIQHAQSKSLVVASAEGV